MFKKFADNHIVLFDGAMGTSIQKKSINDDTWDGKNGCNEYLNIVSPETIEDIHREYFKAGANVAVTNTFGAIASVLAEYSLEDKVEEINRKGVEIARRSTIGFENAFVGLSVGPGTKLASLGHITYKELYNQYLQQAKAGIDADFFMIETAQDILQVRAAVNACHYASKEKGKNMPIIVSFTLEQNETLLTGSDISAIAAVMDRLPVYALGLNCAMGPDMMATPLSKLAKVWGRKLYLSPNAGLPEVIDGETVYPMGAEKFASIMKDIFENLHISMAGGCCGTDHTHINALRNLINSTNLKPTPHFDYKGVGASLYTAQNLVQVPSPAIIGERANATGSKAFRELLLSGDIPGVTALCKKQEEEGAHFIDLSLAYTGRDEKADYSEITPILNTALTAPLVIDSTDPETVEVTLERYSGKPIVNSINLEDGGTKLHKMLDVVKKHPACMVALTIDETGMAQDADKKFKIAERLYKIWCEDYGFPAQDLIIDPLTFSIGSGEESLKFAALETIKSIKMIKENLHGVKTVLGVSNVSFGLAPSSRPILNSVFLQESVKAGLDTAIVHASKLVDITSYSEEDIKICLDLINGVDGGLQKFIERFSETEAFIAKDAPALTPEETLQAKIVKGDKSNLNETIEENLKKHNAEHIINNLLFPAMQKVGELFGAGKMLLPFVLQSAETMKTAVKILEPKLTKGAGASKGTVVIATVQGDVHDIGKNLADIIMTNNGYKVHNLGIKIPVENIIEKAKEVNATAIGMSGLLVKSTHVMKENIEKIATTLPNVKVMLGGAALTSKFVNEVCAPIMHNKIFYCRDAFDNISAMDGAGQAAGKMKMEVADIPQSTQTSHIERTPVESADIPTPPFYGTNILENINIEDVFEYLNKTFLFSSGWGYKRKGSEDRDYDDMIRKIVIPEFNTLKNKIINDKATDPKVIYGYFKARRINDSIELFSDKSEYPLAVFHFPLRKSKPFLSLADYFAKEDTGLTDVMPIQIVTLGLKPVEYCKQLFKSDNYKDYFMVHGLFTELTEALAEYTHAKIRQELGIAKDDAKSIDDIIRGKYRGKRFSFGYPMTPNLENNTTIASLLSADKIGVEVSSVCQMVPEYTTSAFIIHHPLIRI